MDSQEESHVFLSFFPPKLSMNNFFFQKIKRWEKHGIKYLEKFKHQSD